MLEKISKSSKRHCENHLSKILIVTIASFLSFVCQQRHIHHFRTDDEFQREFQFIYVDEWRVSAAMKCDDTTPDLDSDLDGYAPDDGDCNDCDKTIHPNAKEICGDGIDQNCDGKDIDCDVADQDLDGVTIADGDCDDNDGTRNPMALETCDDGIDQDCDGQDLSCDDVDDDGDGLSESGEIVMTTMPVFVAASSTSVATKLMKTAMAWIRHVFPIETSTGCLTTTIDVLMSLTRIKMTGIAMV